MATPWPARSAFEHVTKRFPGVVALDDVSVRDRGRVAATRSAARTAPARARSGRSSPASTRPMAAAVVIDRRAGHASRARRRRCRGRRRWSTRSSRSARTCSVAENLCLGSLPRARPVRRRARRCGAARRRCSAAIGAAIDVDRTVGDAEHGQQQMLQIAAAVGRGARRDRLRRADQQPVAARGGAAVQLIGRLRAARRHLHLRQPPDGRDLPAVRHGHRPAGRPARGHASRPPRSTEATLVEMMIGRPLGRVLSAARRTATPGEELLRVEDLSSPAGFRDVSFALRAGEVVGFAGLVGAGRSEIAQRALRARSRRDRPGRSMRGQPLPRGVTGDGDARRASGSCRRTGSARAWCCR